MFSPSAHAEPTPDESNKPTTFSLMDEAGTPLQSALYGVQENAGERGRSLGRKISLLANGSVFLAIGLTSPFTLSTFSRIDLIVLGATIPALFKSVTGRDRHRFLGKTGLATDLLVPDGCAVGPNQQGNWWIGHHPEVPVSEVVGLNGIVAFALPKKSVEWNRELLAPTEMMEAIEDPSRFFKLDYHAPVAFPKGLSNLELIQRAVVDSPFRRALVATLYARNPDLFPKDYWKLLLFSKETHGPEYGAARRLALGILLNEAADAEKETLVAASLLDPDAKVRRYAIERSARLSFANKTLEREIDAFVKNERSQELRRARDVVRADQDRIFTTQDERIRLDSKGEPVPKSALCPVRFAEVARGIAHAPAGLAALSLIAYAYRTEILTGLFLKQVEPGMYFDRDKMLEGITQEHRDDVIRAVTKKILGNNLDWRRLALKYLPRGEDPESASALAAALSRVPVKGRQRRGSIFPIYGSKLLESEGETDEIENFQRAKAYLIVATLDARGITASIGGGRSKTTGEQRYWVWTRRAIGPDEPREASTQLLIDTASGATLSEGYHKAFTKEFDDIWVDDGELKELSLLKSIAARLMY